MGDGWHAEWRWAVAGNAMGATETGLRILRRLLRTQHSRRAVCILHSAFCTHTIFLADYSIRMCIPADTGWGNEYWVRVLDARCWAWVLCTGASSARA